MFTPSAGDRPSCRRQVRRGSTECALTGSDVIPRRAVADAALGRCGCTWSTPRRSRRRRSLRCELPEEPLRQDPVDHLAPAGRCGAGSSPGSSATVTFSERGEGTEATYQQNVPRPHSREEAKSAIDQTLDAFAAYLARA
jgi:hypothetical protein